MAKRGPWTLETLWVRKDANGVIVDFTKRIPDGDEFIPNVPADSEDQKKRAFD